MTPAVITALVTAYTETLKLWSTMLEAMPEDQRQQYASLIVEREQWWQENVWRKLGDLISGEE